MSKVNDYSIKNYQINSNLKHHTDELQQEVYVFAKNFMKENKLNNIIDVSCGSGYKLVNILGEFNTIGIETDPYYSILNKKYPLRKWLLSGKKGKSFVLYDNLYEPDVVICSNVIEHIIDPNVLLYYLISLNSKYYIISTPCRQVLCNHPKFSHIHKLYWNGPPFNKCHVREWTMEEFKKYISSKFNIISSHYDSNQIEYQYHLLKIL
jgi:2-polyprenyl-3-methyl-5-hydroxy-6-metoxy-1,4-benzoquinol methylase